MASGSNSSVEHELVVADHFYIGLTINGTSVSAHHGWSPSGSMCRSRIRTASSLGAGNVDPLDQLKLLEQKGATVVPLGTSTVDGTTVSGYAVTFERGRVAAEGATRGPGLGAPAERSAASS